MSQDMKQVVSAAFALWRVAGLRDYGIAPKEPQALRDAVNAWAAILTSEGCKPDCVAAAAAELSKGSEFPNVYALVEEAKRQRFKLYFNRAVEMGDGTVRLVELPWSATPAERDAIAAKALGSTSPALPPSTAETELRPPTRRAASVLKAIGVEDREEFPF